MAHEKVPFETLTKMVFKKYDADNSGFIESKEVENVLRDLLKNSPGKKSDAEFKKEADVSFVQNYSFIYSVIDVFIR